MILEALIAGPDIVLSGHTLHPNLIDATLPVPLLREHCGQPVGTAYHLQSTSRGIIAFCETDESTTSYTHVSPSVRLLDNNRMRLLEVSLVRESVSPHTLILARRASDPVREYRRCLVERDDLLIRKLATLQKLVRNIHHGQHSHS